MTKPELTLIALRTSYSERSEISTETSTTGPPTPEAPSLALPGPSKRSDNEVLSGAYPKDQSQEQS